MKPTVSVLGTGLMGSALVRALLQHRFQVTAWNRTRAKAEPLAADGAKIVDTVAQAIQASDVILMNVSTYDVGTDILRSADMARLLHGKTLIELTSGAPNDARARADWAQAAGISYLDGAILATPDVIGSEGAAIIVAGAQDTFDAAADVLNAMATSQYVGDDIGHAKTLDIAVLSLMWGALFGAVHAAALCRAEGVDLTPVMGLHEATAPVVHGLVGDFLQRNAEARFAQDDKTLASVATHYHALHHLVDVMDARGLDRVVVDGYLALFKKAEDAGQLSADFASMANFLQAST